jgi:hypothetical protein
MNRKKPLRFYIIIFAFSSIIVAGYSLYKIYAQDAEITDVYSLWAMPVIFTLFYWGSDKVIELFTKKRNKKNTQDTFLEEISQIMRDSGDFLIEDFRQLQNNQKFQNDLTRAHTIFKDGENEVFTIAKLENKYRAGTVEKKAMNIVVKYLRENQEIPQNE